MRRKSTQLVAALGFVGVLMASGCATEGQTSALIGSLIGAGVGQAIGGDTESTLIGAAVGGGAGYIFGNEQDKLAAQGATAPTVVEQVHVVEPVYVVEPAVTEVFIVYNSNGTYTPVRCRRHGHVWVGPRGERYHARPTHAQLRPIYGF